MGWMRDGYWKSLRMRGGFGFIPGGAGRLWNNYFDPRSALVDIQKVNWLLAKIFWIQNQQCLKTIEAFVIFRLNFWVNYILFILSSAWLLNPMNNGQINSISICHISHHGQEIIKNTAVACDDFIYLTDHSWTPYCQLGAQIDECNQIGIQC